MYYFLEEGPQFRFCCNQGISFSGFWPNLPPPSPNKIILSEWYLKPLLHIRVAIRSGGQRERGPISYSHVIINCITDHK